MPIHKDTVALEACPAKTAETVSYTATFAVLAWLLLSNYSGFGYTEQSDQPLVSAETSPTASLSNTAETYLETAALNETPILATIPTQSESESSNFVTSPPAWHADLVPYHQYESQAHQRTFSTSDWHGRTDDTEEQIAGYIEGLALPLPLIDPASLFDAKSISEIATNNDLASRTLGETELIRGITVTSAETGRQTNRPSNIRRPQIPRPYRAQEIQRSIVLPPRIQALRP